MPKMSPHQKREIQARVRAFNTSGFSTKLHGSVCYYYQSFVGRDFKGWTQMALFILGPYLSDGQKEVLLAYSKVSIAITVECVRLFYVSLGVKNRILRLLQTSVVG